MNIVQNCYTKANISFEYFMNVVQNYYTKANISLEYFMNIVYNCYTKANISLEYFMICRRSQLIENYASSKLCFYVYLETDSKPAFQRWFYVATRF